MAQLGVSFYVTFDSVVLSRADFIVLLGNSRSLSAVLGDCWLRRRNTGRREKYGSYGE